MRRFLGTAFAALFYLVSGSLVRADEPPAAAAVLDKAINALGGSEKLAKAEAFSWKAKWKEKGRINAYECQVTMQGLDHRRLEVVDGPRHAILVVSGNEGWHTVTGRTWKMNGFAIAVEKQDIYLQTIPITLLPIKTKGLKYWVADDAKVGDKLAAVMKIRGPDGKEFTLYFDKDSGLPIKEIAKMPAVFADEYAMEATFLDYKDFDGIKKATRIEIKDTGELSRVLEVTEFKVLDKVAPETFSVQK